MFWLSQVGTDRAVGALDSILRTLEGPGASRRRRCSRSRSTAARGPPRRSAAYAERPDLSDRRCGRRRSSGSARAAARRTRRSSAALYGRLKEESLREKVLFSVSQAGGAENGAGCSASRGTASSRLELRKQALFWAGQGGASMTDLAALYASMPDREMREQLIFVYSQRDEPAAVDKLLEIAPRDPDPELRKKALFWLGQSDDPRAAKALQDIIEQP